MNLGHRRERRSSSWRFRYLVGIAALVLVDTASGETWRGLTVATEHRCSAYDRKRDYPYPQSVEREIVRRLGAIYGPYTGTCFDSTRKTDIEHIVATSEAHDIGAREGFRSGGRERHRPPLARYNDNRNGRITCMVARGTGSNMCTGRILRTGLCVTATGSSASENSLRLAWSPHPERFVNATPKPQLLPQEVWINLLVATTTPRPAQ